jgi:hypothetical protein
MDLFNTCPEPGSSSTRLLINRQQAMQLAARPLEGFDVFFQDCPITLLEKLRCHFGFTKGPLLFLQPGQVTRPEFGLLKKDIRMKVIQLLDNRTESARILG